MPEEQTSEELMRAALKNPDDAKIYGTEEAAFLVQTQDILRKQGFDVSSEQLQKSMDTQNPNNPEFSDALALNNIALDEKQSSYGANIEVMSEIVANHAGVRPPKEIVANNIMRETTGSRDDDPSQKFKQEVYLELSTKEFDMPSGESFDKTLNTQDPHNPTFQKAAELLELKNEVSDVYNKHVENYTSFPIDSERRSNELEKWKLENPDKYKHLTNDLDEHREKISAKATELADNLGIPHKSQSNNIETEVPERNPHVEEMANKLDPDLMHALHTRVQDSQIAKLGNDPLLKDETSKALNETLTEVSKSLRDDQELTVQSAKEGATILFAEALIAAKRSPEYLAKESEEKFLKESADKAIKAVEEANPALLDNLKRDSELSYNVSDYKNPERKGSRERIEGTQEKIEEILKKEFGENNGKILADRMVDNAGHDAVVAIIDKKIAQAERPVIRVGKERLEELKGMVDPEVMKKWSKVEEKISEQEHELSGKELSQRDSNILAQNDRKVGNIQKEIRTQLENNGVPTGEINQAIHQMQGEKIKEADANYAKKVVGKERLEELKGMVDPEVMKKWSKVAEKTSEMMHELRGRPSLQTQDGPIFKAQTNKQLDKQHKMTQQNGDIEKEAATQLENNGVPKGEINQAIYQMRHEKIREADSIVESNDKTNGKFDSIKEIGSDVKKIGSAVNNKIELGLGVNLAAEAEKLFSGLKDKISHRDGEHNHKENLKPDFGGTKPLTKGGKTP